MVDDPAAIPRGLALALPRPPRDRGFPPVEAAAVSEPLPPEEARRQHLLRAQAVVEQAKRILMARFGCGPDVAFELLRGASQYANVRVHVIAEQLVEQDAPTVR